MVRIRQRKQAEEIGFSSPYPFLRPFFATGTRRTGRDKLCHRSETSYAYYPVPGAVLRGMALVTSSPLRLAHSLKTV